MEHVVKQEQLPSGKAILKHFGEDGALLEEQHMYGLDIVIRYTFSAGIKVDETYLSKGRLVSRRTYEKARGAYPDMPPADDAVEDFGGLLLRDLRKQQRRNKAEAERRLAESAESRFPRPASTNWLRVISGERSHLVLFASRDWKALSDEPAIPTGREWLQLFGFDGDGTSSVADGLVVGYEVTGDREAMLSASRLLLAEVNEFVRNPPDTSTWFWRPKRKKPPLAWPTALPSLIEFLADVEEPTVTIFNHAAS